MNPHNQKNCKPLRTPECNQAVNKPKPVNKPLGPKSGTRSGTTVTRPTTQLDPVSNPWDFDGAEIKGFRVSCQSDVYKSGGTYLAALVTDVGNCKDHNGYCRSMRNGYLIIFNKKDSKNVNELASRYFGDSVRGLQQLKNRPYNMKFSTFIWRGNDATFRKGDTRTGIVNFKSSDGRRTQPGAFELAVFYPLLDAWRNQKPYYSRRAQRHKIRGKTVMLDEVEQTAKNDLGYLKQTDLFLKARDGNQLVSYFSRNSDYDYDQNNNEETSEGDSEYYYYANRNNNKENSEGDSEYYYYGNNNNQNQKNNNNKRNNKQQNEYYYYGNNNNNQNQKNNNNRRNNKQQNYYYYGNNNG